MKRNAEMVLLTKLVTNWVENQEWSQLPTWFMHVISTLMKWIPQNYPANRKLHQKMSLGSGGWGSRVGGSRMTNNKIQKKTYTYMHNTVAHPAPSAPRWPHIDLWNYMHHLDLLNVTAASNHKPIRGFCVVSACSLLSRIVNICFQLIVFNWILYHMCCHHT